MLALLLSLPLAAQTIYLIGDSTCADKKLDKQNPERGWGQLFPALVGEGWRVENHATNGRSTKSFRGEGRWDVVAGRLKAGDYLFIEFGHNDPKPDSARHSSPEAYGENLRRYVREARAAGATPVLLTPIVRRNWVDGVLTDTHGDYPAAMKRVAAEEQVTLIDMEALTREWVASMGDEESRRYFMWVEPGVCPLYPDGRQDNTHLNVRGAHAVARMVAAEAARLLPIPMADPAQRNFVVAQDGSGDFFTLSEAVAALPDFTAASLYVRNGLYREKVAIPPSKTRINLIGESAGGVRISWDAYASKPNALGVNTGTSGSSTIYFGGDDWCVENITFENTAGPVGQAVAVQCMADGLVFRGCRFLGNQDTLYVYGSGNRDGEPVPVNDFVCFEHCYIEGTTDFIFGAASALFYECEIRSKSDSYVTAASTCLDQDCGMVFCRCRLTADEGVTKCYLGRPWRNHAQTLFLACELGAHILPEGWHNWNKPAAEKTARYGEYASTGEGAAPDRRVKWARQLSRREVMALPVWKKVKNLPTPQEIFD